MMKLEEIGTRARQAEPVLRIMETEKKNRVLKKAAENLVADAETIIAANALVLSNAQLEPNSVYSGVPAKKVKEVTPQQREEIIRRTAHDYMLYASWFKEEA